MFPNVRNYSVIFIQTPTKKYKTHKYTGCPRGVMVKAMDCEIGVSEFELQSCNCVHLRTNTLGKGKKPLILPGVR